ncbi:MAG TPA: hypothetical protein VIK33_14825 [Anaerolineae bacterium]
MAQPVVAPGRRPRRHPLINTSEAHPTKSAPKWTNIAGAAAPATCPIPYPLGDARLMIDTFAQ